MITAIKTGTVIVVVVVIEVTVRHRILSYLIVSSSEYDNDNDGGRTPGRIVYQQLGPEPPDADRRYLEERQAAGDFKIHKKAFADGFWRYFTTDSMHSFYAPGSEEEGRAFATPQWEPGAADE